MAAILLVGLMMGWAFAWQANRNLEDDFVRRACTFAGAINPERVKTLTGTLSDLSSPHYLRLKDYVTSLNHIYRDGKSISLISSHNGGPFLCYLDSEPWESGCSKPPGTLNAEIQEICQQAYHLNNPVVGKGASGTEGEWITVVVPLLDRASGKPVALLQYTGDAVSMRWTARKAALPSLLLTVSILTVLGGGAILKSQRARQVKPSRWLSFIEVASVFLIGAGVTLFCAWTANQNEAQNRSQAFEILAERKADYLAQRLRYFRDESLRGLANFLQNNQDISKESFESYVGLYTDAWHNQAWGWVPVVRAQDKERFERAVQAQGNPGFRIWQKDQDLQAREVYFPLLFLEPLAENQRAIGFDIGSEPKRRAALEWAMQSGLVTASEPVDLVNDNRGEKGLVIVQPVYADKASGQLRGFALAVLKLENVLQSMHPDPAVSVDLIFIKTGQYGAWRDEHLYNPTIHIIPILAFGKVMLIVARPGPVFSTNHPINAGWLTLGIGLLLTGLLTVRTHAVICKRDDLQKMVLDRTAALTASEARYRDMFEKNRAVELLVDPSNGSIFDANPSACAFYGYEREKLKSMKISEINTLPERQILSKMERACAQPFSGFHFHHRLASGAIRDVEVYSTPISLGNREVLYSIIHDITQRKIAEHALIESETNFRVFFESIADMVAVISQDGLILRTNPSLETKLGYSGGELFQKSYLELYADKQSLAAKEIFDQTLKGKLQTCRLPVVGKSGVSIPVETRLYHACWDAAPCIISMSKDLSAEQEAQKSFKRLFQNNPIPMGVMSLTTRKLVDVNKTFFEQLGYTKEEIIGKTPEEIGLFTDDTSSAALIATMLKEERVADVEIQYRRKDGQVREALFFGEIITTNGQKYVLGAALDISERKQAEKERQAVLRRFYQILSSMYSGVLLVAGDGTIEYVNPAICALFNIPLNPEAVCGLDVEEANDMVQSTYVDPEKTVRRIREIVAENQPVKGEEIAVSGGRTFLRDFVPLTVDGKPQGRLWLFSDVSRLKQMENELKRQVNLVNTLFDSISDVVFFRDTQGVYLGCNPAALKNFGKSREEVLGRTSYDLFDRALADKFREDDREVYRTLRPSHCQLWIPLATGGERLYETAISPFINPEGEVIGVVGIGRDITEHRRLEDALREANQMRDSLVHMIVHDMRSPLTVQMGFLDLLLAGAVSSLGEAERSYLLAARQTSVRLMNMVNSMLDVSRMEAGSLPVQRTPNLLGNIASEVFASYRPLIENRRMILDQPENPGPVLCDAYLVRRVLENLVGNALRYTSPDGMIRVVIARTEAGECIVKVIDDGPGIDPSLHCLIFEKFKQAGANTEKNTSGLGLTFCRLAIEAHGGGIGVESQVGKGSVFWFTLPSDA